MHRKNDSNKITATVLFFIISVSRRMTQINVWVSLTTRHMTYLAHLFLKPLIEGRPLYFAAVLFYTQLLISGLSERPLTKRILHVGT